MRAAEARIQVRTPIKYVDLAAQFTRYREEMLASIEDVLSTGRLVDGPDVERLEEEISACCGVRCVVALNSGTDALALGMRALGVGPGDEVITPPNSFIGSTAAIVSIGATPVFADVRDDLNIDPKAVEAAIRPQTKAIMPVHLTGRMADMDRLTEIAERHGLAIVEDAAQAFGSRYRGRWAGSIGSIGCFSAHPLKNLAAAGDAGFITTDDEDLADRVRSMRNHGLVGRGFAAEFGGVSRMDSIQAALLRLRLKRLPEIIARRRRHAERYAERLDPANVLFPREREVEFHTYHTFVVQVDRRDELKQALAAREIGSAVHYPVPIHLQPAAESLGYSAGDLPMAEGQARRVLSLPVHEALSDDEVDRVASSVNAFYQ